MPVSYTHLDVYKRQTGKTASLERLFRTHPILQSRGEHRSPLLRVIVPAPCTLKTLGREVLRALGYPLARELADHIIWARIQELLPVAGVLIVHFDETHNLTDNANVVQMENIRTVSYTYLGVYKRQKEYIIAIFHHIGFAVVNAVFEVGLYVVALKFRL